MLYFLRRKKIWSSSSGLLGTAGQWTRILKVIENWDIKTTRVRVWLDYGMLRLTVRASVCMVRRFTGNCLWGVGGGAGGPASVWYYSTVTFLSAALAQLSRLYHVMSDSAVLSNLTSNNLLALPSSQINISFKLSNLQYISSNSSSCNLHFTWFLGKCFRGSLPSND